MKDSGTLNYANAVGQVGTVYLPVPPGRSGIGKIQVMIQGRLKVVQAQTGLEQRLDNLTKVRVVEQIGPHTLLVEPLVAAQPRETKEAT